MATSRPGRRRKDRTFPDPDTGHTTQTVENDPRGQQRKLFAPVVYVQPGT